MRGKPPVPATDLWISVAALTLTVLVGAVGAAGGLFSLAFLDYCPPDSCTADGAATAVLGSVLIAALVGLAGLTVTIIRLVRRKPGWPFAIATLCTCRVVCAPASSAISSPPGWRARQVVDSVLGRGPPLACPQDGTAPTLNQLR